VSDNDDDGDHEDDDGKPDKPKKPAQKSDYPVGYGRPPKHTQFKPGQSGNPKGRREGSKNVATLIDEHLRRRVPASVDGKRQRITKAEALVVQTLNKAINDPKIGLAFMQHLIRSEGSGTQPNPAAAPLPSGPEQDRIIEEFLSAVRASAAPYAASSDGEDDQGGSGGDA
jgi:hypothetical protein